jgi:hypothetical protein
MLTATSVFVMGAPTLLLTKANVTMFPCPTNVLSLVAFLVEDACVGVFMIFLS